MLDTQTRDQIREELLSFLRALSIPAIFVTHDRTDAMALADKIVVLRDGVIMQSGPAADIFRKPANSFVARFVGIENILDGRVTEISGGLATLAVGNWMLRVSAPIRSNGTVKSVSLGVRAEDVMVRSPHADQPSSHGINQFEGRVIGLHALGPLLAIHIDCGFPLKAYLLGPQARAMNIYVGGLFTIEIAADAIHIMTN